MRRLELIDGQAEPSVLALDREVIVGRTADADVRVYDETVSRRHARIFEDEGRTVLEDLDSSNGTWLNGERLAARAVLFDGDVLAFGDVRFRVRSGDGKDHETVVPRVEDRVEASVDPSDAVPAFEGAGAANSMRLRLVCDAAAVCADADEPDALAKDLLALIHEALEPDRATLTLRAGPGRMRLAAAMPADAAIPTSRTLRQRVLEEGEAVLVRDAAEVGADSSASMLRSRFRSTLAAPLRSSEGTRGVLYVEAVTPGRYDAEDLRALAAVARQAGLALRSLEALSGARMAVRNLEAERTEGAPRMIGETEPMLRLRGLIQKAAQADAAVLVRGETGTGKELVARRLHAEGPRASKPFVALNCAALVEGLLESEFFGHEKGAFTDAKERREGRIHEAGEGTLFLDEVGELSASLQAKLLRVLSERAYTRVGGRDRLEMHCRVVAATNRDLAAMVAEGTFREDLYYRLAVVVLEVPPLRERRDDVPLLTDASLERLAARLGRRVPRISESAYEALVAYAWPGNVRELLNVLERALVLLDGDTLHAEDFPSEVRTPGSPAAETDRGGGEQGVAGDGEFGLHALEKRAVAAALRKTGGKKGAAAELLGVSWPTLNRKIRSYGLEPPYDA